MFKQFAWQKDTTHSGKNSTIKTKERLMVIAVITPTYKEEDNIEKITQDILAQQSKLHKDDELHVVISDSHSPDKTPELAKAMHAQNPRVHYVDVKERGIGIGIVEGFQFAVNTLRAEVLISMDADLSHPTDKIPVMIQKIREGNDLVIGSRYAKGGSNNYGPYRKLQSWLGNQVIRYLIGIYNVQEFLTSYRALRSTLFLQANLDRVPWRAKTFVFQPAFIYELFQHNPKYVEVPIDFVNRRAGRSKMNTLKYISDVLKFAIKARIKKSKQFVKFLVVGSTGFAINTTILLVLVEGFKFYEPLASSVGAEIAIISNFIFNNSWTFKHNKIEGGNVIIKFLQFNFSSLGAILIQYVVVWFGVHYISPLLPISGIVEEKIYLIYYIFAVGLGLIYNYVMYSRVIWKKKPTVTHAS